MIRNKGIFKQYYLLIVFVIFSFNTVFSQINTPPIATYDVATADQDTTLDVIIIDPSNTDNYVYTSLLDNDIDADGDTLSVTQFSTDGGITWNIAGDTSNIAGIGSITINADGTYTFVPVAGYSGVVPNITYEITDGIDTAISVLYLTVETSDNIFDISNISSCNQGFTIDPVFGEVYMIKYNIEVKNISKAHGYHHNSEISNIQLFNDLNSIFGNGCIVKIKINNPIKESEISDFLGGQYDFDYILAWDSTEFDASNSTPGAQGMLNIASFNNAILYPGQSLPLEYCVYVKPFCNGRPNPTPSGSGIDFDNIITGTSSRGSDVVNLIITDFHTAETTVAANFYMPIPASEIAEKDIYEPIIEPNATYNYDYRIIITNDGMATANNVNFNLGLFRFIDKEVTFQSITVSQVSGGPVVTVNVGYDGMNSSLLLTTGNNLNAGETVILNINFVVNPIDAINNAMYFEQLKTSMTQGVLDQQGETGQLSTVDEFDSDSKTDLSYVFWDDALGSHLDRYYKAETDTEIPSSNDQCKCEKLGTKLGFALSALLEKESEITDTSINGIDEFKEVTFTIKYTNTTEVLEHVNIQIIDDLTTVCSGNIVSVSTPIISNSTASVDPIINNGFDGILAANIFDGVSGSIKSAFTDTTTSPPTDVLAEFVEVQFKVVYKDDCIGHNQASATATDLGGRSVSTFSLIADFNVFSDNDNDGVTDVDDIDDDNDGIPDLDEYGGMNPLDDSDGDLIPNYRDTTATNDINGDGIVDVFDFDMDGVPNHFDLDSDNDGITDIVEAGGLDPENDGLVPINADETLIIDADNDGLSDSFIVDTNSDGIADTPVDVDAAGGIQIPNYDTDGDTHVNALDIDSDNDGIVDNIEAQVSDMNTYIAPNTPDLLGLVYTDGLIPIDTDGDTTLDYLDTDSDDDTRADVIEGWDTNNDGNANTVILNSDSDNDGLDDAFDINSLTANPLTNATNTQIPTDFPNIDNSYTIELDWREIPAIVVIISNESEIEGNDLNFTISLISLNSYIDNALTPSLPLIPKSSTTEVKIELYTSDGDGTDPTDQYDIAKATFDYIPIIQSASEIIIPAGDTSYTFTMDSSGNNVIKTIDDTIDELNESFILNGLVITENTVNPATNKIEINVPCKGTGIIVDNDDAPDLIMNDDTKDEGDPLIHIVQIDNSTNPTTASSRPIDIKIVVTDQTAIHPEDYTNTSPDTVTIPATDDPNNPNTSVEYVIETILDVINEPDDETIAVAGTVTAGNVGTVDLNKIGTIIDKQPPPKVVISNPTVVEGDILEFIISLVHPATNDPLAHYEDIIVRVFTSNGTAREPDDYLPIGLDIPMHITIPATVFNTKIQVITNDDKLVEDIEDLTLFGKVLSLNADNIDAEGIGSIIDNDLPNLFSPNDDGFSDVFEVVHLLQYLDFKLQIFDRWGSKVYNYRNNGNPFPEWWNGTKNGNPVPEGVYYYTVDYNDGKTRPIAGFIQLIR